jgi:hypothetical protein
MAARIKQRIVDWTKEQRVIMIEKKHLIDRPIAKWSA